MTATLTDYLDDLSGRRNTAAMTLEYIHREQSEVNRNWEEMAPAAYERRVWLLQDLAEWYTNEMTDIDNELARMAEAARGDGLAVMTEQAG
jgi:uncharacterized protein YukE